ncbi:MAG: threonine/serine exporter family protein [Oscillospiraceae bacterium]|nr:threonine/serine exporter family protein [Oscillospiraceae bacterium]
MDYLNELVLPALYSFIASIAFGIQFNIRFRHIIAAAVGGIISQVIFNAAEFSGSSEMLCYFLAACSISIYAEILARRLHVPVNMYLVVAIIPLVPGSMIYNAMITLLSGDNSGFAEQCALTFGVAGSIAMGVFAVSSAARILTAALSGIKKAVK